MFTTEGQSHLKCSFSGPNNVLNTSTGLYQQSVTLTARMWPPIEAGSPKIIWHLPVVIWSIIIGFIVIIFILASLFLCCWLLPKHRKILSPTRDCTSTTVNIGRFLIILVSEIISRLNQIFLLKCFYSWKGDNK